MGIYIKGMKMPKSCIRCKLTIEHNNYLYCNCPASITSGDYVGDFKTEKHPDCTLIEIPTPHGDLISRREALEALTVTEEMETVDLLWLLTTRINDLPTIEPILVGAEMSLPEPKCADGCIYGWGSDECEKCRLKCEPKTGHWEITDAYPHNVFCSECYTRFAQTHWAVWEDGSLPRKFCPNCGAKMDKE